MSETISSLIKAKLKTIEARKAEAPGNSEHALRVLEDYALYFQGAHDIAKFGAEESDLTRLKAASDLVTAEITAIEQRLALEADLED